MDWLEVMRCVLTLLAGDWSWSAGGDVPYATLYTGGCRRWALFVCWRLWRVGLSCGFEISFVAVFLVVDRRRCRERSYPTRH